jgi:hypothetical protein
MNTINPLIEKLKLKDDNIKIKLYHSLKDETISVSESRSLHNLLNKNNIKNYYFELEIDEKLGSAYHHRIHKELIKGLF